MKKLFLTLLILVGICWNVAAQVEVYPQLGHTSDVNSVAFSPDGRQIISGSRDGTIKLWDATTGRVIRTIFEQITGFEQIIEYQVLSVAFSPDGRQIIAGYGNAIVKLWDVATGREIRNFEHTNAVLSVAFSPDGRQILSGSKDGTIKLWDAETGRETRIFSGHISDVNSVAFSPDGRQIISGSGDGTIKLWDATTGREIRTFKHTAVISVAFSPDGKQVLSGTKGYSTIYWDLSSEATSGNVKLWDTATGQEIRTFSDYTGYNSYAAFSPDGRQIITVDETIKLWDAATGREIRTFSMDASYIRSAAFSPDGKQIIFGSDETIKLWDAATGREIRTFSGDASYIRSAAFSPDGRQIIVFYSGGTIKLWDATTGREIRPFPGHTSYVRPIKFSPDGKQILLGSDKTVKLWDVATGREIRTFSGHTESIASIAFSADGRQIISGSYDKTVKLWDVATGREIRTFSGHTAVISVAFSPDGKQILFGSDKTVKLWDVATGREIRTFSGHTESIASIAFSADGRQIISGSFDRTVKLWDTATGRVIRTFGHTHWVLSVAFSPDGRQVLSDSRDGTLKLWDAATGREIKIFSGFTNSAVFSHDGKQIIIVSSDSTLRLWDVSTGREIAQFISFNDGEWIALTPDGYYNSSPNGDRYLNVRVGNDVFGIDQYRATFYRPQIVEARLNGKPDPVQVTTTIQNAASFVPPVVVIVNPENGANVTTGQIELSVRVVDQQQPIRSIQVYLNGRLVGGETLRGMRGGELVAKVETTEIRPNENQKRMEFRLSLNLDPGLNRIEVIAKNPYSEGRDNVEVNNQRAAAGQNSLPNLWILSIGVNRYDAAQLENLEFAVNDAREIINAFKAQEGKTFNKVNSLLIADGAAVTPTRNNIVDNFSFLKQATSNDTVLLFIAGHGLNDESNNFFFMPSDAGFNTNGSIRPSLAISYRDIQSVLDVPGRKLVFIDACHSAGTSSGLTRNVDNVGLIRSLNNQSTVIISSSTGTQSSQEIQRLKHGVFTYAIIQGLKGEAARNGVVTMYSLNTYIDETVLNLTNRQQQPTISLPNGFTNFDLAKTGTGGR